MDTCQFRTILVADVPRVRCAVHGTKQILVPWAEPGSGFTALFEALVIDWLKEASDLAVARRMGLTWDQASGIQERAVARGLARRAARSHDLAWRCIARVRHGDSTRARSDADLELRILMAVMRHARPRLRSLTPPRVRLPVCAATAPGSPRSRLHGVGSRRAAGRVYRIVFAP